MNDDLEPFQAEIYYTKNQTHEVIFVKGKAIVRISEQGSLMSIDIPLARCEELSHILKTISNRHYSEKV